MWYRLRVPLILCFVMGLLAFGQEFIPHPWASAFRQEVTTWFRIMGGFAMFIGAYSLLHMHLTRIRRKLAGWGYSAFVFLGASAMIATGVAEEILKAVRPYPQPDAFSLFDWLYTNVQVPCGATIFSILAFFMASAAFRTFRARNVSAAMLLVAAIIVMFGRVPISEWVGGLFGHPGVFPKAADILMEYPNLAAKRGIRMGISLGAISQSLRILFGIDDRIWGAGLMATPEALIRRQTVARRIVYFVVAIAVIIPYIVPLPLKFEPSDWARKLYDRVEGLEPGSVVLFSFDYDPSAMAELYPMCLSLLRHCFRRDLRPIVMTHWPNGVGISRELLEKTAKEFDKTSGHDYVFLGYKPGWTDLVLNMGESLQGAFDRDYYGKPTEGMPALEGVRSLRDVPLVVDIAAGSTVEMWIAYGRDRFEFDLGAGCTAVIAPDLYPFLQSGQLIGFLGGLRGAADYETMLDKPEDATKGMQAQSLTHLLIITLIIGANVAFVVRKLSPKKDED